MKKTNINRKRMAALLALAITAMLIPAFVFGLGIIGNESYGELYNIPAQTTSPAAIVAQPAVPFYLSPEPLRDWLGYLDASASSIVLQNRPLAPVERQAWINDYFANGGMNEFELEIIRLINVERARHGLTQLEICLRLSVTARYQATLLATYNQAGHDFGPYQCHQGIYRSLGTAMAFGAWANAAPHGVIRFNGAAGRMTPQEVVQGWMNSPGHAANILATDITNIGTGSVRGGVNGFTHYQFFNAIPLDQPTPQQIANSTITFNANGGTGTMSPATLPIGFGQNLPANTFSHPRAGYAFVGWSTSPTGAVVHENAAQFIAAASSYALYAVWERGPVDLTQLRNAHNAAQQLESDDYTAVSWGVLQTAKTLAAEVLSPNFPANLLTWEVVDARLETLLNAKVALVPQRRDPVNVFFPDPGLAAAMARTLGVTVTDLVTIPHLEGVTQLNAAGYAIENLDGIQYLTNLRAVNLSNNNIADISRLTALPELGRPLSGSFVPSNINLSNNRIVTISNFVTTHPVNTLNFAHNLIEELPSTALLPTQGIDSLYFNNNRIVFPTDAQLAAIEAIPDLHRFLLQTQTRTLAPIDAANPLVKQSSRGSAPSAISHGGTYAAPYITWANLPGGTASVSYEFSYTLNLNLAQGMFNSVFNPQFIQPINPPPPPPIDRTKLRTLLVEANTLRHHDWTAASWTVFNLARTSAQNMYNNTSATQNQIDAAYNALNTAMNELVDAPQTPAPPSFEPPPWMPPPPSPTWTPPPPAYVPVQSSPSTYAPVRELLPLVRRTPRATTTTTPATSQPAAAYDDYAPTADYAEYDIADYTDDILDTPPPAPSPILVMRLVIGSTAYTYRGQYMQSDVAPFLDARYSRTMVPLRIIADALGADVRFDSATRTVYIYHNEQVISLVIDVPLPGGMGVPVIIDNRTFVPLRYVSETLGVITRWESGTQAVYIYFV